VLRQLSASIEKVFHSLDADGNGFLDRNELKAGFASMVCAVLWHLR
jgi:Ca2+-binding EF-hand superfamily protein